MNVWRFLGRVPYEFGLSLQRRLFQERAAERRPDTLLLVEHPPTVTLGRRAGESDLRWRRERLAAAGVEVFRIGRGGAATIHAPGQLVGYPIVRLGAGGRSVRRFVTSVESVLVRAAARFGIDATVRPAHPGAWVGEAKIAAVGIQVERGVTRHGFAFNVDMDLSLYDAIVPCGMPHLVATDLRRATGRAITVEDAVAAVIAAWREEFGETVEEAPVTAPTMRTEARSSLRAERRT